LLLDFFSWLFRDRKKEVGVRKTWRLHVAEDKNIIKGAVP
jgi:hypothetical protein